MLYRSVYFLFHDEAGVRKVIDELENRLGFDDYQLHAIVTEDHTLLEMPGATVHKKSSAAIRTEKILWYLSVSVFTIALIAMVVTLLAASWYLALLFALLVVGAQLSGYLFGSRIPNAQLDRFRTGLEQGDIVLQVDVPRGRVDEVKGFVGARYPDSLTNISNWSVGTIGH
ncbi:MAG: hypothetical protein R6X15_10635 [Pseudomonadota bacterium]